MSRTATPTPTALDDSFRHPWSEDLEDAARQRLADDVFGFIAGGAGGERTVAANRQAFERYRLIPRVLVDVADVSTEVSFFDRRYTSPLLVAPMGTHRLVHQDGEVATTRGAVAAGCGVIASTAASTALEQTAQFGASPQWFQLYMFRDRNVVVDLVHRAVSAGYEAICLTVDTPVLGDRRGDVRRRFQPDAAVTWANLEKYARSALPQVEDGSAVTRFISEQLDPSVTWEDLDWLVRVSPLPVVLKGVLNAEDARRGVVAGAAGILVSNHGGRQLDRAIASLDALPAIVEACEDVPVLLDGGIRDAADVAIALALGATAVTVGRPVLWALACGGEQGVGRFLEELVVDLARTLALLGVSSVAELRTAAPVRRDGGF